MYTNVSGLNMGTFSLILSFLSFGPFVSKTQWANDWSTVECSVSGERVLTLLRAAQVRT